MSNDIFHALKIVFFLSHVIISDRFLVLRHDVTVARNCSADRRPSGKLTSTLFSFTMCDRHVHYLISCIESRTQRKGESQMLIFPGIL